MSEPSVLCVIENHIAIVTLNRPAAANGLDLRMAVQLAEIAARIDANESVKAVIITAQGRFFCAGGDLKSMQASDEPGYYIKSLADTLHRAISIFDRMAPPVVVAINGTAAGAGFSLALTGDLAIAAQSSSFTMAYTKAGLSPDGSSTYYMPRLVGMRKTKELMLTNRTLHAAEALDWGLINEVVADENLMVRAMELASGFVEASLASNAAVKQLLAGTFKNGLEEQMELESRKIAECLAGEDGQEGARAFVEKRRPKFRK